MPFSMRVENIPIEAGQMSHALAQPAECITCSGN
jgi:hypothetical protein